MTEPDMTDLKEMTDLLYGEGEPMRGGNLTLEEARVQGKDFANYKPYRIVRDWIWADLDVNEKIIKDLETRDLKPVMVYAHDVMYDSTHRFDPGNWVRTTPLVKFTPPCFFETQNTVYILIGDGKRKTATVQALMSIH
tara:strand:+ start:765 stop:1178 length:414 start_codon:yes stop_codon:yes gene_type:complete